MPVSGQAVFNRKRKASINRSPCEFRHFPLPDNFCGQFVNEDYSLYHRVHMVHMSKRLLEIFVELSAMLPRETGLFHIVGT